MRHGTLPQDELSYSGGDETRNMKIMHQYGRGHTPSSSQLELHAVLAAVQKIREEALQGLRKPGGQVVTFTDSKDVLK